MTSMIDFERLHFPMPPLRLCRFKPELTGPGAEYEQYYAPYHDKVYVLMGEFAHARDHVLLMEFGGTWSFTGMHEMHNLEMLDQHPDDVTIFI